MWAYHQEIESKKARLVFIGNGPPFFIQGFKSDLKIDGNIYTDPSMKSYEAAGLKRSKWATLGPKAIFNALVLFIKGYRQKNIQGDPWQQGGVLVIKKDGSLVYRFISQAVGDEPPVLEILKAID